MSNTSGMIVFQAVACRRAGRGAVDDRPAAGHATCGVAGGHRSLAFWMEAAELMETSFRLSAGLEDAEDLITDLDRVL
ncbi:hypothetical protein [Leisingera aquimarina]|uniref:hypothetical protein n=1 Tax=Leisingera aquimarina TaxID=476529 RepID=UPI0012EBD197|nr:hypothetical protein [Leisingera aquimarina]